VVIIPFVVVPVTTTGDADEPELVLEGGATKTVVVVSVSTVVVIVIMKGRTLMELSVKLGRVIVVVTPLRTVMMTLWAARRGRKGSRAKTLKCIFNPLLIRSLNL